MPGLRLNRVFFTSGHSHATIGPVKATRPNGGYFTGHLRTVEEPVRRFGFQFTFFRIGMLRDTPDGGSAWAARDIIMGHAALTELDTGRAPLQRAGGAGPPRSWAASAGIPIRVSPGASVLPARRMNGSSAGTATALTSPWRTPGSPFGFSLSTTRAQSLWCSRAPVA